METVQSIRDSIFRAVSEPPESKKALLIIDDNPEVTDALSTVLKRDYRLWSYDCFEDAEIMAAKAKVALLDIKMANKDGITVFSLLKELNPEIRIIFHSAYPGDNRHADMAAKLPHDGYLTKGEYSVSELRTAIRTAFQKYEV